MAEQRRSSVSGREFSIDVLRAIMGLKPAHLSEVLEEAVRDAILKPAGERHDGMRSPTP